MKDWFKQLVRQILKRVCRRKLNHTREDILYNHGIKKVLHSFDIAHIVKQQRAMSLIQNLMFAKYQRSLLPYLKENVLDSFHDSHEIEGHNT
jgi:hypothetical protein